MMNYALISQNARKIMDKDSLMVVPKIEKKDGVCKKSENQGRKWKDIYILFGQNIDHLC